MGDICRDNRFEIIAKAKVDLLNSTNIDTSDDEMKVIDSFLFRCCQMGWLERYDRPREPLDIPTMITDFIKEHGLPCPEGYKFRDENGNVIETKKIVLEKKKPKYPRTINECREILEDATGDEVGWYAIDGWQFDLLEKMQKLLICRDAYWEIAGEEMGLGRRWKPDWNNDSQFKYIIICRRDKVNKNIYTAKNCILDFPTEEMRDAFYNNFKELIEECKELL